MDLTCTERHGGLLGLIAEGCVDGFKGRPRLEYTQQIMA